MKERVEVVDLCGDLRALLRHTEMNAHTKLELETAPISSKLSGGDLSEISFML